MPMIMILYVCSAPSRSAEVQRRKVASSGVVSAVKKEGRDVNESVKVVLMGGGSGICAPMGERKERERRREEEEKAKKGA